MTRGHAFSEARPPTSGGRAVQHGGYWLPQVR